MRGKYDIPAKHRIAASSLALCGALASLAGAHIIAVPFFAAATVCWIWQIRTFKRAETDG
jgi:hypothetical protein